LPAGSGVCPLPASGDRDLSQSAEASEQPAAGLLAQHPSRPAYAEPDTLGGRHPQRLSTRVLEVRLAAPDSGRHRASHPRRPDGPPHDPLCARRGARNTGCIPLLLQTGGGIGCSRGVEGVGSDAVIRLSVAARRRVWRSRNPPQRHMKSGYFARAAYRAFTTAKNGPTLYDLCDPLLAGAGEGNAHLRTFYKKALANPALRLLLSRAGMPQLRDEARF